MYLIQLFRNYYLQYNLSMLTFQQVYSWKEWSLLSDTKDKPVDSIASDFSIVNIEDIPESIANLTDDELRKKLQAEGAEIGPILNSASNFSLLF